MGAPKWSVSGEGSPSSDRPSRSSSRDGARSPKGRERLIGVATAANVFEAQVLVARLTAEGLSPRLPGPLNGPYPFTLGSAAQVEVFVPEDEIADARLIMLATEIDAIYERPRPPSLTATHRVPGWLAGTLLLCVVATPIAHVYLIWRGWR